MPARPPRRPTLLLVALHAALLFLLAACTPQPVVDLDLRVLDAVPVIPIQTDTGTSSALLLDDGTILTCSHAIPRGQFDGNLCILGFWTRYTTLASGDNLAQEWGDWKGAVPANMHGDWSYLKISPVAHPADIFHPALPVSRSTTPPREGETVYVVGYTIESIPAAGDGEPHARLVRHWVPLVVIPPPTAVLARTREPVIWLHSADEDAPYLSWFPATSQADAPARGGQPDSYLAPGFSGTPLLRRTPTPDGSPAFEACGILVCADRRDDSARGRFGLAIPVPAAAAGP